MSQLKIRVGASVDRSLSEAYKPLIEAAKKARAAVENEGKRTGATVGKEHKKGTDAAEKEYAKLARDAEKWHRQMVRDAERATRDEVRAHEHAQREMTRATERESRARNREIERSIRANQGLAGRVGSAAAGMGKTAGRAAIGIAGQLARGAGVDLDVGSLAKKNVELETMAVQLSNSGYFAGKAGPAGARQDPKALIQEARDTAMKTGMSSNDVMAGQQAFVGKTGDLQTSREVMFDLSKLSKATGASMEDVFDAAGDVANALGDTDKKGEKVKAVMAAIAGQGKLGAVEIKNLASQMAKLGASAGSFEGESTRVMAEMGALAQMSRAKGGSASATQAATSVQAFTNTFSKGARLDAFQNMGVNVRGQNDLVRSPKALIVDAIRAASATEHGGMANFDKNMGKMFMDVRARSATRGFETVFKQAGGGEAGIEAVKKSFDELADATMNQKEIAASFAAAMSTDAAQANKFNEQLAAVVADVQKNLSPALASLAPLVIDAAKAMAKAAGILTGAPKNDEDAAGRGADLEAQSAGVALQRGVQGGKLSKGQLTEGQKALAELDAQIAKKKANMTTAPSALEKFAGTASGYTPAGLLAKKVLGQNVGEDLVKAKGDRAEQDERQLKSMVGERDRIARALEAVTNGTMKVEIVADRTARPGAAPALPPGTPQMPSEPKR